MLGSVEMFDDAWLDREDNAQVMDWVFRWLRRVRVKAVLALSTKAQSLARHTHAVLALCGIVRPGQYASV